MTIYQKLKLYGCNVDIALNRFSEDRCFFLSALADLEHEVSFAELGHAIQSNDSTSALDSALVLKSIIGSLELEPLFSIINTIIQELRDNEYKNALLHYNELIDKKNCFYREVSDLL